MLFNVAIDKVEVFVADIDLVVGDNLSDFDEVCKLHFTDSISSSLYYDFNKENLSVIDIGTGAGFPGIVLKIVFPKLHVTLLDSLNKRINFLNEVIDALCLNEEGLIVEKLRLTSLEMAEGCLLIISAICLKLEP